MSPAPAAALLVAALSAALLSAGACSAPEPQPRELVFEGPTMGTRYVVKAVLDGGESKPGPEINPELEQALDRRVEQELEAVNSSMSTYLPDSELSRFNRWRGDEPFALSTAVLEVLARAQEISRESGGAFDVTVGPLVNAFGFGPAGEPPELPDAATLEALRGHVGWQKLELDAEAGAARKLDPELYVDLSAVAKGYAVDQVAEALIELGVENFMVEVGGEVRTGGRNALGRAWRIGIEAPIPELRRLQRVVELEDRALATSGDYRNFYLLDGRRLSHTIDPRSGGPVEHGAASVSVLADDCLSADGWATALMVLGPELGLELAERQGLAVLFLLYDGHGGFEEQSSTAFRQLARDPQ